MLNNYRVTFGGIDIDYKSNFEDCRGYISHVINIMNILKQHHINDSNRWFFFEPYAEITWIDEDEEHAEHILDHIAEYFRLHPELTNIKYLIPSDGEFADWYFFPGDLRQREFSYNRYALCARQAELFYEYFDCKLCESLELHYMRSCHVLANQLGLSYKEEGRLLFWQGILCKLFWWFGHTRAIWIYTKIFRQKY